MLELYETEDPNDPMYREDYHLDVLKKSIYNFASLKKNCYWFLSLIKELKENNEIDKQIGNKTSQVLVDILIENEKIFDSFIYDNQELLKEINNFSELYYCFKCHKEERPNIAIVSSDRYCLIGWYQQKIKYLIENEFKNEKLNNLLEELEKTNRSRFINTTKEI